MFEVGTVLKLQVADTTPPKVKYLIIVGQCSDKIATIFINSGINLRALPEGLQALNFPLSPDDYQFLSHESFANCAEIAERDKGPINTILQKEPTRKVGMLTPKHREEVINIVKRATTISPADKEKYKIGISAAPARQMGAEVQSAPKSPDS